MYRRLAALAFGVALFSVMAGPALADGIIIPVPRPREPVPALRSLAIKYHHVSVAIAGQVATTHVDQVFLNENSYDMEGTYMFPLPEGASISQFAMWVDGQRLEAELLDRDKARSIYEDIVRQQRDPALLEYAGQNAFRARVYPIPARGEKRVEIEYTEVLPKEQDIVRYLYPLNTEKFSTRPLQDVSVSVRLVSSQPIKAVYSPSHEVQVVRKGAQEAAITYSAKNVLPDKDWVLYYSASKDDLGLNLMSFREGADKGFFMLLLTPKAQVQAREVIAKDVLFVLDTSGSMRGDKLKQAKAAANYVLDNLNPGDRFNIISFGTSTEQFGRGLQSLSATEQAHAFVRDLVASGGTNIGQAMQEALGEAAGQRPRMILFLTDGVPTEGERDPDKILQAVKNQAKGNVRLFAFGVGYDVNTTLLDSMAQALHGVASYVRPEEDLERAVSAFYEKVSNPVLTDLKLDFGRIRVDDIYPYPLPDVFAGGQMVVVGRYRDEGETTLTLRGTMNGQPVSLRYDQLSFRRAGGADFIPRLWATRKIGHLLTEIRLHGSQKELVEEVVNLSIRYGIVTPYTSFLVNEREDALSADGRGKVVERELRAVPSPAPSKGFGTAPSAPAASTGTGAQAVEKSIAQQNLRLAEVADKPSTDLVKQVGAKAFVLRDGAWVDTTYDSSKIEVERVAFGSARYFQLVAKYPEWQRYLALGPRVTLVWDGRAYGVEANGDVTPLVTAAPDAPKTTPGPVSAQSYNDCFRNRTRSLSTWVS